MGTTEILQGALDALQVVASSGTNPAPGEPVTAGLSPALGDLDITEALAGELDLTFVSKDVLFSNDDLEPSFLASALDAATTGGQPAGVDSLGALVPLNGIPGTLGQLKGSLPMAVATRVPVSAQVTWRLLDEDDNPLDPAEFRVPAGLSGTSIEVVFAPETAELTTASPLPAPVVRKLEATVTLVAGGVTVGPRTLPPVPVLVPVIPIPKVFAGFVHTNFQPRYSDDDGAILLVVPPDSVLSSATQLQSTLNTLQGTLTNLSSFAQFAGTLLGLSQLTSAISAHKSANIQFRATNSIGNLNDITLIQNPWYQNDIEAEDELSSLFLLGPEGASAELHVKRKHKGTAFEMTTGSALTCIVRSLHTNPPTAEAGTVSDPGKSLPDCLSSFRFT